MFIIKRDILFSSAPIKASFSDRPIFSTFYPIDLYFLEDLTFHKIIRVVSYIQSNIVFGKESWDLPLCPRNFVYIITWYFQRRSFRNDGNMNLIGRVFYWTGDIALHGVIAYLAFWLGPVFLAGLQAVPIIVLHKTSFAKFYLGSHL